LFERCYVIQTGKTSVVLMVEVEKKNVG